jgi:hypothetical protein
MPRQDETESGIVAKKRFPARLAKAGAIAWTLLSLVPAVGEAQVFGTAPNGQMGFISTPNPLSPNCAAPNTWTAFNGHYMCAPPQPSCQYGFASGPYWDGNNWVYSCNAPPAPPPVVVTPPSGGNPTGNPTTSPAATCAARAATVGISIGPLSKMFAGPPGNGWYEYDYYNATGPETYDINGGNAGYGWWVSCRLYPDGVTWAPGNTNPFQYAPDTGAFISPPPSSSGGG